MIQITEKERTYNREWYQRNKDRLREHRNEYMRGWHRRRTVLLKNKSEVLVGNKPVYPATGECTLCGGIHRLYYHHWSDEHPEWGIWLCLLCHTLAEKTDKDLDKKYRELKNQFV